MSDYSPVPSESTGGFGTPIIPHRRRYKFQSSSSSSSNLSRYTAIISSIIAFGLLTIQFSIYRDQSPLFREWSTSSSSGEWTLGNAGSRLGKFDAFGEDFPKLRSSKEVGVAAEVGNRERLRLGWREFDWPSINTLFVFGDDFSMNEFYDPLRTVGEGRKEPLFHLDHWLGERTWPDWLFALFKSADGSNYFNLARSGATVSNDIIPPWLLESGTLKDQIDAFEKECTPEPGPSAVDWRRDSSLFMLMFGLSDISKLVNTTDPVSDSLIEETCQRIAESLFEQSERLYSLGARDFLFLNLYPFDKTPKYSLPHSTGYQFRDRVSKAVPIYNQYFDRVYQSFQDSHPESNVMRFDLHGFVDIVTGYPEVFGLTDMERYRMKWEGRILKTDSGRFGYAYKDWDHPSWLIHSLVARSLNGFLLRQSRTFRVAEATEDALFVPARDGDWISG